MRVFSFGGGVQSTAVLVLAVQGKLQYDAFLFANVGTDSENPDTLAYVNEYSRPFAAAHGLNMIELNKTMKDGSTETVAGRILYGKNRIPIPVYMNNGAPGKRACTSDFKIAVIAKWQKKNGATADNPAITGLGISLDEWHRARTDSGIPHQVLEYPLIDLRIKRQDCMNIIRDAGLPIPPKSSCFFCPFHRPSEWNRIKRDRPDLWQKAIEIERKINATRSELNRDYVYLHRYLIPLEKLEGIQTEMFGNDIYAHPKPKMFHDLSFDDPDYDDMETCESGYCMT